MGEALGTLPEQNTHFNKTIAFARVVDRLHLLLNAIFVQDYLAKQLRSFNKMTVINGKNWKVSIGKPII